MKTGFVIVARLKSSRLPLKLLMDLKGKKIVEWVIERAMTLKGISEIILCTSTNPQDYPLVEIALEHGIYYFAGSEVDVLDRMYHASRLFSLDYVVGITGENPLFCRYHAQRVIDLARKGEFDYIKIDGLPLGTAVYCVSFSALEKVVKAKGDYMDTEIWGAFFDRPDVFKVETLEVSQELKRPNYRLTLDYPEDYKFLRHIFNEVPFEHLMDLSAVIEYIDNNPSILELNRYVEQRSLSEEQLARIGEIVNKIKDAS